MRKIPENEKRKCPLCNKTENQIKMGYNKSGTQRCKCKECNKTYTLNPKSHEYPTETRELALKMYHSGISGREIGKILGMNKANVHNWIKKEKDKHS